MSDGIHDYEAAAWPTIEFDASSAPPTHLLSHACTQQNAMADIERWLPRLGSVLWIYRGRRKTSAMLGKQHATLTAQHPALLAFARCTAARLQVVVTSQGPRECVTFVDRDGEIQAKMFLLPDTDYLAWDGMLSTREYPAEQADTDQWQAPLRYLCAALARLGSRWHAMPVRFAHGWPGLSANRADALSPIGTRLVQAIARDEHAEHH